MISNVLPSCFNEEYKKEIFKSIRTSAQQIEHFQTNKENLFWACTNGHLDIVKEFEKYGFNIFIDENKIFSIACKNGHFDLVQYLIEKKSDIYHNNYGFSFACEEGHFKIVEYLIEKGITTDTINNAFKFVCREGQFEMVKYLSQNGANIHVSDDYSFLLSCEYQHEQIIDYFIFDLNLPLTLHIKKELHTSFPETFEEQILSLFKMRDFHHQLNQDLSEQPQIKKVKI